MTTGAVETEDLLAAWGGFPAEACSLEPRKLGELKRDGYHVEKLVFQTLPGLSTVNPICN